MRAGDNPTPSLVLLVLLEFRGVDAESGEAQGKVVQTLLEPHTCLQAQGRSAIDVPIALPNVDQARLEPLGD